MQCGSEGLKRQQESSIDEGALAELAELYLDILRKTPDDMDALLNLGMISERYGQLAEAEFFYTRCLQCDAGNGAAQKGLERLFRRQPQAPQPAAADAGAAAAGKPTPPREREVTVQATVRLVESEYAEQSEWFRLAAKEKAGHVISLCRKNGIAPRKVVEIGAGGGAILSCLDRAGFAPELHALEVSSSGVEVIRKQQLPSLKSAAVFDGYSTPYRDQEFDVAILSHVLEHVEYERLLLREMQRISRHQVIEIPIDYNDEVDRQWIHYTSYGHINVYNPTRLRFLLATERFRVVDDLAELYSLDVIQYIHFENNGRVRTPEEMARVTQIYQRNSEAMAAMPALERERHASSYTVLTRRMTDEELFHKHLELATSYHQQKRDGDVSLVLGNLRKHGLENLAPLPSWAVSELNRT